MRALRGLRRVLDRVAEAVGEALPAGIIDPWILWWIILSLMLPLLLAGVIWMAEKGFIVYGSSDLKRLLRNVERRYSGAFDELGPGAVQDFKHLIDCVDGFLDLFADPRTDFRVKLNGLCEVAG